ncbi:MAG TPA: alpha/beta fold hydrolase [Pyrinomonadaceae bacterium]|nr:alpha/beta fold hydrolase [Pyrinomonadaceae bacterium]
MPSRLKVLVGVVLVTLSCAELLAQNTPAPRKLGELWFEPFKFNIQGTSYDGELGRLVVKENRAKQDSKTVELAFVRLKSTAAKPGYPVIYLDGGPGSSAIGLAQVPDYMRAFQKLREVGDVILLDQRGIGRSRPNLTRLTPEPLPTDIFAGREKAQAEFTKRFKEAAEYFRSQGVDLSAYNTRESAHDVDDIRKALGVEKVNLVGYSYGTHLGLACIRYHGENLNRVVLIGTEGPDHTDKLPSTSDNAVRRLAKIVAADPEIGPKAPDLYATLKRVMDRLDKTPAKVTVTDRRTNNPVELTVDGDGLRFLIRIDLGDTNDLPIFPAWFVTMDRGDYSILARFAERRYNQFGGGAPVMTVMVDGASGATEKRREQIAREAKTSILSDMMNFPSFFIPGISEGTDLGDEFRSSVKTAVPTLFFSGELDNNTQPFQADEVRKTFKTSTHIVIPNAGHESMLTEERCQQTMVDFLNGRDVSSVKIALPPLKFIPIPDEKKP